MFDSIITGGLTIVNFLICMVASLFLGLVASIVNMKTGKSNHNFSLTLSVLPVIVTTVIMMVNGNLGTGIAVAGAFSLVRFRSLPGNSKEILFVFFAMAIGLACASGYIAYAVCFTALVSLFIIALSFLKFGEDKSGEKILKITIPEDLDYTEVFKETFTKYLSKNELVQVKTTNMGSLFELTYKIKLKNNIKEKELIDDIRIRNGNLKINLSQDLLEERL